MISMSPVSVVFSMVQSLTMIQYFLKKKLNSLKDITWGILHEKSQRRNKEKIGNMKFERQDTDYQTKSTEEKTPEMEPESFYETIVITQVEVDKELETKIDSEQVKKNTNSENANSSEVEKDDLKKLQKMFWQIKFAKFLISDFCKILFVCLSYVVKILFFMI
jgi:hypothetical protein